MITLTRTLNRVTVSKNDLETLLDDLATASGEIRPGQLPNGSVVDRLLLQAYRVALARRFGRKYGAALTYTGPFGGYYVIDASVVACNGVNSSAINGVLTQKPVCQAHAYLYVADASYSLLWSRAAIGYSTDNGANWTALTPTSRPFALGGGQVRRIYDAVPQPHYWTGGGGYYPMNAAKDKAMILLASFGGEVSEVDPATVTHYGVMVNSNTDANLGGGAIFLTDRDIGL